jgi:hypothetical protein
MIDQDFSSRITELRDTYSNIRSVIGVERLQQEVEELSAQAGEPDLWDDTDKAQKVTSDLSHRQADLKRIDELQRRLDDLDVLVEMAKDDEESAEEAVVELAGITKIMDELEVQTLLNGEFDPRPAVVTIRAGAGGVDAADFAEMLMRMYLRWAEQHDYSATVLDTSYAEEAGIKSATFEIDGETFEAPAGTYVSVQPEARRKATGDATVLALGGTVGEAYQGMDWGDAWSDQSESMQAYGEQRYADAAAVRRGLEKYPDHAGLNYNYACFASLAGEVDDETFDRLRRGVEGFPPFREQARGDGDLDAVRDDPRFEEALR